jgi:hypothetical protein
MSDRYGLRAIRIGVTSEFPINTTTISSFGADQASLMRSTQNI